MASDKHAHAHVLQPLSVPALPPAGRSSLLQWSAGGRLLAAAAGIALLWAAVAAVIGSGGS